jgi:hypothetical protein
MANVDLAVEEIVMHPLAVVAVVDVDEVVLQAAKAPRRPHASQRITPLFPVIAHP